MADIVGAATLALDGTSGANRGSSIYGMNAECLVSNYGGWQLGPGVVDAEKSDTALTAAGWCRLVELSGSAIATGSATLFQLGGSPSIHCQMSYNSGTGNMTVSCNGLSTAWVWDEDWHHWLFTLSSGTLALYVDGVLIDSESFSPPSPFTFIGVNGLQAYPRWSLYLDEVMYFNRGFTQDDVDDLFTFSRFPEWRGLKSHQLGAEVAYSANSASTLTGLLAHQMAAEVAYSANGSLSGLMAHQMAAEVGYSPNGDLSGIIAHQLAAEVAFSPTLLYATGQPTTATWDVEAASPSPVLAATTATWDVEAVVVPVIATPTEATWDVEAAVPPISGSSTTAAWDVEAAYMGASGDPTSATWSVDAAVPPISGSSTTATWDVDRVLSNAIEAQSTTSTWSVDAVVPPIGSTTPAAAAWSVDKVWFREPPEFKYVFLTNILCQLGKTLRFKEETDNEITATIKDEHGHDLDSSDFDFVLLTLYDNASQTLLRPSEVVSGSLLTIDEGDLLWRLLPRDTDIINDALRPPNPEKHTALIEFAHGTERTDDLTDPFATSSASNVITVTHPSHDLQARDHVWFVAESTVGGLTLTGLFLVTNVIDADSYQVVAHRVATGTATGGGSVTAYRLGYSNKAEIVYEAAKSDVL